MEEIAVGNTVVGDSVVVTNKPNKVFIGIVVVIVAFTIFVIVAIAIGSAEPKEKIEVSGCYITTSYSEYLGYSASVRGSAKNITNKNYSYVQLEFTVYDASHANLGTALANINNLAAGDTWNFEATLLSFPSSKPVSFILAKITTF
ncbi:MAG: hypothetical protein J5689_02195 [Clostridia bacterium]|nr:hypothetical protein [Clostridia bacterium]